MPEVRQMAVAIQANLVQLKIAQSRRRGAASNRHEIAVVSPGKVTHFRETLIERSVIKSYSDGQLQLRLHEVWGQFCLMQWLFHQGDADQPSNFGSLLSDSHVEMRCGSVLSAKYDEIHALLWRLQFEQRMRHETGFAELDSFENDKALAAKIPALVFGEPVSDAAHEDLLLCACQHAGMLAAISWVLQPKTTWGDPTLMEVAEKPFAG